MPSTPADDASSSDPEMLTLGDSISRHGSTYTTGTEWRVSKHSRKVRTQESCTARGCSNRLQLSISKFNLRIVSSFQKGSATGGVGGKTKTTTTHSHWERAKKFIVRKNRVGTNLYCGQSLRTWAFMVAFASAFYMGLASLWVSFFFIFKALIVDKAGKT